MPNRLVITEGPNKGQAFVLTEGQPFLMGRGRQTATRLLDPHVSREHCQLVVENGYVVVRDLGSVGGTFVNGERVRERPLLPGDRIQLGQTSLVLEGYELVDLPTLAPEIDCQATLPPPDVMPPPIPSRAKKLPEPSAGKPNTSRLSPPGARAPKTGRPPPREPATRARPTPPAPPAMKPQLPVLPANRLGELSGSVLAHFHLGAVIAKGRSGIVFQALDLDKKQPLALKVFWPEFARHDVEVRRFVRAMRTMMPLRHPHLVSVLGAGKKGAYCWVGMELVVGESLHEMIVKKGSAGMLDWRHAFRIAQHLAQALEFAHDRKIIHRNITPRNVLVRFEDRGTLLGDLMLARALEGTLAQELTQPGEMLGDVRFMSPERTQGSEDVDGRSDLYSLGALLYTLLTGQPPFEGYTIAETVMQIRQKKPTLLKKFQLSIPDRFQDVVLTLLAKRPESRFQTPLELLADLARIAKFHDVRV